jgi:tetraacyldisaccharide 4'-kinase
MREPTFWWSAPGLAAALLSPLANGYGAIASRAFARRGARADVPVLCVGNPTVGGSGKTPTAIAVATLCAAAGRKPMFLTRGYGGRLHGPVRVDPKFHTAADVGDEPLLLARAAPTIVARDRVAGANVARSIGTDVIVMDDGFQNPSLIKDLALLVVDGRRGIGNARVFPAGPLRAPLLTQLDHADALLVIGAPSAAALLIAEATQRGMPVLHGRLDPDRAAFAPLAGQRLLAFAGIADPNKFFSTLVDIGMPPAATLSFPDHHRYSAADADGLIARAQREALTLVTTEKDLARLQGDAALTQLASRAHALPVSLRFEDPDAVRRLVLERIQR